MSDQAAPEPKKPSAVMAIVKPLAIVSVLVVIELVAATMLIPSAEATEKLARDLAKAAKGEEHAEEGHDGDDAHGETGKHGESEHTVEVKLFSDNLTRFNPETGSTLNIELAVYGVVLAEEKPEFEEHFEASSGRIREQVMLTIHAADAADLSGAGLGLIKRQILEKTNRTLGKPLLREVVFTKLNFIER